MKIPFLNARIGKEFEAFLSELETSVQQNVNRARAADYKDLYAHLFPLFVLLRSLSNSAYVRDPARDTVLAELRLASTKKEFLEAAAYFNKRNPYQEKLKIGLQRQVFTGYFQELFSDALLLLNSFYTSNYRGAQIALRCMLEDLYRHFYYRDHPQEFWAIGEEGKRDEYSIGVRPRFLREYLVRTSYLSKFSAMNIEFKEKQDPSEQTLFDLNENLYARCSAAVHGSGDESHNAFQSNVDLVFTEKKAKEVLDSSKQFSDLAVAFLTSAHIDQFITFSEYERSMVLAKFSDQRRASLRRALNI